MINYELIRISASGRRVGHRVFFPHQDQAPLPCRHCESNRSRLPKTRFSLPPRLQTTTRRLQRCHGHVGGSSRLRGLDAAVCGDCRALTRAPMRYRREFDVRSNAKARAPVGARSDEGRSELYRCGPRTGQIHRVKRFTWTMQPAPVCRVFPVSSVPATTNVSWDV